MHIHDVTYPITGYIIVSLNTLLENFITIMCRSLQQSFLNP